MVIINADDFGISEEVNHAILTCFQEGVISSATIMANMPAFEQACHLAAQNNLFKSIGIHINISEGIPITTNILRQPRFCNANGEFCFHRNAKFFLTQNEKAALTEEIDAQIKRCLDMGLSLTHLDSHYHVHTEWSVFDVIQPLVLRHKIRFVRSARNDNPTDSVLVKSYKALFNIRLSFIRLRKTRYFGDIEGFRTMSVRKKKATESFEVMVHPTVGKRGTIIDKLDGTEIIPRIRDVFKSLSLVSFS